MRRHHSAVRVIPRRRLARMRMIAASGLGGTALLALSLQSLAIADQRTRIARADATLAAVRRDYASIEIEYAIRGGPAALARLTEGPLGLAPARAPQYLSGLDSLAALARPIPGATQLASR